MSVTSRRVRKVAAVALAAGLAVSAAACSKDTAKPSGSGQVTLVLQTFGNFGYDKAIKDFEAANSGIKVDHQKQGELRDFAPKLAQWLATGSGAGDVVGLEEGLLLQYIKNHQNFLNLFDLGGKELENSYLKWKWERGLADGGKKLLGLGTDVGGLAMCYRVDHFQAAGLPTNRDEVGKLWASGWEAYVAKGKEFQAKSKVKWMDSSTAILQPYVMQNGDQFYFDENDKFVGDTNPTLKKAWDLGIEVAQAGMTTKVNRWTDEWNAAFKQGTFATMACPSWMLGVIQDRAGAENANKWDVAKAPGGSGNWGGSYLAIPKQSQHPNEAYKLAKYLTGKDGHLASFEEAGGMPSDLAGLDDPRFKDKTNAYFNNAPSGAIFAESVKGVEPMVLGSKHQQVQETIFEAQLAAAEKGQLTPQKAWDTAVAEAKKLSG
jgi:cellobiose transport system substrate-binding protein